MRGTESFSAPFAAHAHCLWCLQCPARLPAPFLQPVGLLCARTAQTMLLPFRGNPQNVQTSVRGGSFGRGRAAPVPGLSSPPQACAGLMVAQAHHNQQKSKVSRGRHRPKTIFMSVGSLRGGSRSVVCARISAISLSRGSNSAYSNKPFANKVACKAMARDRLLP